MEAGGGAEEIGRSGEEEAVEDADGEGGGRAGQGKGEEVGASGPAGPPGGPHGASLGGALGALHGGPHGSPCDMSPALVERVSLDLRFSPAGRSKFTSPATSHLSAGSRAGVAGASQSFFRE